MRCRRAAVRFELPRAVSRRHDVARSSNLLLRNWRRLEKLLIIESARSSAHRVAKNVVEGGETVREMYRETEEPPRQRRLTVWRSASLSEGISFEYTLYQTPPGNIGDKGLCLHLQQYTV